MWELDFKESWALKNWCFWIVVLEKTLESPLDCKEIQPVHPKGNQSWIFTGRTDAEPETPIVWPPVVKNWLSGKDPEFWKDWRWEMGPTDGWLASPTQWTWDWVGSRSWWWTGRPGMLQSMGSQRVGHDWVTKLTDWQCGVILVADGHIVDMQCNWGSLSFWTPFFFFFFTLKYTKVVLLVLNLPSNAGDIIDTGSLSGLERSPWRR